MQNEAMKNVVENDAEQGAKKPPANRGALVPKKRKPRVRKAKVRKGRIISAPRDKPEMPVSARLSREENDALEASAAVLGKRSKSEVIRKAIQQYLAQHGNVQVPTSLGVVDGIYQATIYDDVVKLANQLRALEFASRKIADQLETSPETPHLRHPNADGRNESRLLRKAARAQRGNVPAHVFKVD